MFIVIPEWVEALLSMCSKRDAKHSLISNTLASNIKSNRNATHPSAEQTGCKSITHQQTDAQNITGTLDGSKLTKDKNAPCNSGG